MLQLTLLGEKSKNQNPFESCYVESKFPGRATKVLRQTTLKPQSAVALLWQRQKIHLKEFQTIGEVPTSWRKIGPSDEEAEESFDEQEDERPERKKRQKKTTTLTPVVHRPKVLSTVKKSVRIGANMLLKPINGKSATDTTTNLKAWNISDSSDSD